MNTKHKAKKKALEEKQERQARNVISGIALVLVLLGGLIVLAYTFV